MRSALIRLANPWRWAECASPRLGYVLGLVHFVTVTNLSRITKCWNSFGMTNKHLRGPCPSSKQN
jgi:hypothetical protein